MHIQKLCECREWAGHTEGVIHYHLFNYITAIKASQSDQAAQSRFTDPSAIACAHTPKHDQNLYKAGRQHQHNVYMPWDVFSHN